MTETQKLEIFAVFCIAHGIGLGIVIAPIFHRWTSKHVKWFLKRCGVNTEGFK